MIINVLCKFRYFYGYGKFLSNYSMCKQDVICILYFLLLFFRLKFLLICLLYILLY